MNAVLIMPSMRWQNWPLLRAGLAAVRARAPGLRLDWMPVVYPSECEAAGPPGRAVILSGECPRWINPLIIAEEPGVNHCMRKQNAALDALEASGYAGWIVFWSDDNLVPWSLGKRLLAAVDRDQRSEIRDQMSEVRPWNCLTDPPPSALRPPPSVIVFSCARGQRIPAPPPRDFGTDALIAAPENMRVGRITGEQYAVHSRLLHGLRFPHNSTADGQMVEALYREATEAFRFVPDFFVPFNALEEGRWDADKLKEIVENQA